MWYNVKLEKPFSIETIVHADNIEEAISKALDESQDRDYDWKPTSGKQTAVIFAEKISNISEEEFNSAVEKFKEQLRRK